MQRKFYNKHLLCVFLFLKFSAALCKPQEYSVFGSPIQLPWIINNVPDTPMFQNEYDFIIIGAGSGGSVIANRLSENPKWSVLLLEAGGEESFLTDIPLMAALQSTSRYNWGYKSVPTNASCLGLLGQRCNVPRGKAIGGTSVINFLVYTRGNRQDFDEWERLGNTGWSYERTLPYFLKSENCSMGVFRDEYFHGYDGYLNVQHPQFETPLLREFIQAGVDLGYSNADPNGRSQLGFSKVQATMREGARCSAAKAFLAPVTNRPNLRIEPGARVTRILINSINKIAYGVEFIKNKTKFKVNAKKEVVLSAGSINSPQLLMLSGVGPKEDLEHANIPLIQELKVGYNLQDHLALSTLVFLVNESITVSDLGVQNIIDVYNYFVNGKGPYTIPGGAEGLAFVKTKLASNTTEDYPDIELVLGSGAVNGDFYGSFRQMLGIPDNIFREVYGSVMNLPAFSVTPVLLRPRSKGRIVVKDGNPLHWPIIDANYLENEYDEQVMVEGIKMAIKIVQSKSFQKYSPIFHSIPWPGCENYPFNSDPYWACFVRHTATTLGHQVGTCKMGPKSDPEAVVDSELRVHGISRLRVVDGSIMPNIVAGHTNAVIIMIGEKAADMIKKTWKNKNRLGRL